MSTYTRIKAQFSDPSFYDSTMTEKVGIIEFYLIKQEVLQQAVRSILMREVTTAYTKAHASQRQAPDAEVMWTWAFESGYMREEMDFESGGDYRGVKAHWNLEDRILEGITVYQRAVPKLYKREQEEYIDAYSGVIGAILAPLPYERAIYGANILTPFTQELLVYVGENQRPCKVDLLNKSFEDIADSVFDYAAICGYKDLRDST